MIKQCTALSVMGSSITFVSDHDRKPGLVGLRVSDNCFMEYFFNFTFF